MGKQGCYSRADVGVVDEEVKEGRAVEGGLERPGSAVLQVLHVAR